MLFRKFSKILHGYIYWQLLKPFLIMLLFFISIMLSTSVWNSVTEILLRGIPWTVLIQLIGFLILEEIPDLVPLALLFAGILVSGNLSEKLEYIAMRSCRIPISAIVNRYLIFGSIVAVFSFLMNSWVAPVISRERTSLLQWIQVFQGLSLVRERTFVVGEANAGETIGFYTGGKSGYTLENVFVQQVGPVIEESGSPYHGVKRILFAQEGAIARFARTSTTAPDRLPIPIQIENANSTLLSQADPSMLSRPPPNPASTLDSPPSAHPHSHHEATKKQEAPRQMRSEKNETSSKRPLLFDVSFATKLGDQTGDQFEQSFLRLRKGYSLLFADTGVDMVVSNFSGGSFDYMLVSNSQTTNHLSLQPGIFTLPQLSRLINGFREGGLAVSFYSLFGKYEPPRIGYAEKIKPLDAVRQLLHQPGYLLELPNLYAALQLSLWKYSDATDIPNYPDLNQQELQQKLAWTVPAEFDTPLKREFLFSRILKIARITEDGYHRLQFNFQKRFSKAVNIVLLMLMALPLGLSATRSGKGIGAGVAVAMYLVYYMMALACEKMYGNGYLGAFSGSWIPEFLLAGYVLVLYQRHFDVAYWLRKKKRLVT